MHWSQPSKGQPRPKLAQTQREATADPLDGDSFPLVGGEGDMTSKAPRVHYEQDGIKKA